MVGTEDHEAFCDYWRTVPGARGLKVDWEATWRTWMRRARSDRQTVRGVPAQHRPNSAEARLQKGREVAERLALKYGEQPLAIEGPGIAAVIDLPQFGSVS